MLGDKEPMIRNVFMDGFFCSSQLYDGSLIKLRKSGKYRKVGIQIPYAKLLFKCRFYGATQTTERYTHVILCVVTGIYQSQTSSTRITSQNLRLVVNRVPLIQPLAAYLRDAMLRWYNTSSCFPRNRPRLISTKVYRTIIYQSHLLIRPSKPNTSSLSSPIGLRTSCDLIAIKNRFEYHREIIETQNFNYERTKGF